MMQVGNLTLPSLNEKPSWNIWITLWAFDLRLGRGVSPDFQPRWVSLRLVQRRLCFQVCYMRNQRNVSTDCLLGKGTHTKYLKHLCIDKSWLTFDLICKYLKSTQECPLQFEVSNLHFHNAIGVDIFLKDQIQKLLKKPGKQHFPTSVGGRETKKREKLKLFVRI